MNAYLQRLFDDSKVVEVRHNVDGRWHSGLFSNVYALEAAIRDRGDDGNLYSSLNRPAGIGATNAFDSRALRDDDMEVITRIVFDLDPERPAGTPSTDAELQAAICARDLVVRTLTAYGWPAPALGVSGNGGHIVYRTSIKSTAVWKRQAAVLYAGMRQRLRQQFDDLGVSFDTTVRNPGRIWRLYGTVNRKGETTADRPHRRADIVLPAGPWQTVKAAVIERTTAAMTPVVEARKTEIRRERPHVTGSGDFRTLDIVAWFTAHGSYLRPLAGKHAVRCPWFAEHTTRSPETGSDTVVWEATDGWPTFHCSHAHCSGRSVRDVMALWGDADQYCAAAWERPA